VRILVIRSTAFLLLLCLTGCSLHTESGGEQLGQGYSRKDGFVYYDGKRIDQQTPHDLDFLESFLRRKLIIPTNVDAASFQVLSKQYSKDKNTVYYRWIRGTKFWFVEITGADSASFEYLASSLGRDKNHVWRQDRIVAGAHAPTTEVLGPPGRVWKDQDHVWFAGRIVKDADPATFEALGDGYHYRDANRKYWIFNVVKVLEDVATDEPRFAVRVADMDDRVDGRLGFDLPQVPGTHFSSAGAPGKFHVLANDRPGGTGAFTPATLLFTWQVSARVVERYQVVDEHATHHGSDGLFKFYVLPYEFDTAAFSAIREKWHRAGNARVLDPIRIEIHAGRAGQRVAITMIGPPPERLSIPQFADQVAASLRWVNN
jgi:hypothetical protein